MSLHVLCPECGRELILEPGRLIPAHEKYGANGGSRSCEASLTVAR